MTTLIEFAWTLVAVIGVGVNAVSLAVAAEDVRELRNRGINSLREVIARGNRRRESLRLVVTVLFTVAGAQALLTPNTPRTRAQLLLAGLLVAGSAMVLVNSILDARERSQLIVLARRARRGRQEEADDAT